MVSLNMVCFLAIIIINLPKHINHRSKNYCSISNCSVSEERQGSVNLIICVSEHCSTHLVKLFAPGPGSHILGYLDEGYILMDQKKN